MVNLNFHQADADFIRTAEKSRGYKYYEFTEREIRRIASADVYSVPDSDWRALVQMLHPRSLICSGLFDAFLIFEISPDGQRSDPPKKSWHNLTSRCPGEKDCLLQLIISALADAHIPIHESWRPLIRRMEAST